MGKFKFKIGDKLKVIEKSALFDVGEIVICNKGIDTDNGDFVVDIFLPDGNYSSNWKVKRFELIEKKSPSKNVSKMKKTIYHVIAVDKKTGKTTKNETISADNEQQAILKAFGVDAENTFIKTTEVGDYEEDKPLKAVLEKPAK